MNLAIWLPLLVLLAQFGVIALFSHHITVLQKRVWNLEEKLELWDTITLRLTELK